MNRRRLLEVILSILVMAMVILVVMVRSAGAIAFDFRDGFSQNSPGSAVREHPQNPQAPVAEQPVTRIELAGPIADPSAELSGLAWYGESLILLPQYPHVFDDGSDGSLFYLPKAEILEYIEGQTAGSLEPRPIPLIAPGLETEIAPYNYQGFESIGFSGDRVFLTIEAGRKKGMMGYLISGTMQPDLSALKLDTSRMTEILPQADSRNRGDEAMLVLDEKLLTFYEANGRVINPRPVANIFNFELEPQGTLSMPNVEYRITDAAWAEDNQFWAINYFFIGDFALFPNYDPIADSFGEGPTHAQNSQVERLLKFQYSESGITLLDAAPVELELTNELRNWEGLALLDDRGFLMVTDKYPTTVLAFVPFPE